MRKQEEEKVRGRKSKREQDQNEKIQKHELNSYLKFIISLYPWEEHEEKLKPYGGEEKIKDK